MKLSDYRDITIKDKELINAHRLRTDNPLTALSFPSLFTWKEPLGLKIHIDENFYSVYSEADNGYFCPVGTEKTCHSHITKLIASGEEFKVMYLTEVQAQIYETMGASISLNRDLSEYLYGSELLSFEQMPRTHKNYRERVNRFRREYDYEVRPSTAADIPDMRAVLREGTDPSEPEYSVYESIFDNYEELEISGVVLRSGSDMAYMLGYRNTDDIFTVTVTDATAEWKSISVAACEYEIARFLGGRYRYIDAEEDLGIQGLRKVKVLTRPVMMLDAWEAVFNRK